jgi:hypothetical protein
MIYAEVYEIGTSVEQCRAGAAAVAFESFQVGLTSEGSDEGIQERLTISPEFV